VAGRDFLLIADAVAPLGEGVAPLGAAGLSRALAALGNRTTVLTLASADVAGRVPGLARRLRTVTAVVGDRTHELTLFEGRASLSDCPTAGAGGRAGQPGRDRRLAGCGRASLANDKLIAPEVTIGWGEPAAAALSATSAAVRLFVCPRAAWARRWRRPRRRFWARCCSATNQRRGPSSPSAVSAPTPSSRPVRARARRDRRRPWSRISRLRRTGDRGALRLRRPAQRSA
jgi:hypothetical protein